MEFKEAVKVALQSLWANKLRSVLTLLGVVIGVTSVIAVVTLVNGANTYVTTKFSRYGADVFTVSRMPQIITSSEDYQRFQRRKNILLPDYPVCGRELQALHRDWSAADGDGKGCARDAIHDRYQHPRIYVADADAAKPEYRAGPRVYRDR